MKQKITQNDIQLFLLLMWQLLTSAFWSFSIQAQNEGLPPVSSSGTSKKKVVLFYIDMGKGHETAVNALKSRIEAKAELDGTSVEVVPKNIRDFSVFPPVRRQENDQKYLEWVKTEPDDYDRYFRNEMEKGFEDIGPAPYSEALVEYLREQNADTVIGAHWDIPYALAQIRDKTPDLASMKIGWVFTDYYQGYMPEISKRIDMTFLGGPDLTRKWESRGVSSDKVVTSGIPLNPLVKMKFTEGGREVPHKTKKDFLKEDPELSDDDDVTTITLASGGEGIGDFPAITRNLIEKFKSQGKKLQLVVVAGNNDSHFQKLGEIQREFSSDPNIRLKVEKLVPQEKLFNYIKASDLYITKTGGLSPTEGAAMGVPMVLMDVLGGHERANAEFYKEIGIGEINNNPSQIGQQVTDLLFGAESAEKRSNMARAQLEFASNANPDPIIDFALSGRREVGLDHSPPTHNLNKIKDIEESDRLYNQAIVLYRKGPEHLSEAIPLFEQAKALNPTNWALLNDLAFAYKDQGEGGKSMQVIAEAIRLNPKDYNLHYHQGIYLKGKGDKRGAIEALNEAFKLDKLDAGVPFHLAEIYAESGEIGKANELAQIAMKIAPNDYGIPYRMGLSLAKNGKQEEAIQFYQSAIKINEDVVERKLNPKVQLDPGLHSHLGQTLSSMGRLDEAEGAFKKAIEVDSLIKGKTAEIPDYGLHYHLGLLYKKKGELRKAERSLKNAISMSKESGHTDAGLYSHMAQLLLSEGWEGMDPIDEIYNTKEKRRNLALDYFLQAIAQSPEDYGLYYHLGKLFMSMAKDAVGEQATSYWQQAASKLEQALELTYENNIQDNGLIDHLKLVYQNLGMDQKILKLNFISSISSPTCQRCSEIYTTLLDEQKDHFEIILSLIEPMKIKSPAYKRYICNLKSILRSCSSEYAHYEHNHPFQSKYSRLNEAISSTAVTCP